MSEYRASHASTARRLGNVSRRRFLIGTGSTLGGSRAALVVDRRGRHSAAGARQRRPCAGPRHRHRIRRRRRRTASHPGGRRHPHRRDGPELDHTGLRRQDLLQHAQPRPAVLLVAHQDRPAARLLPRLPGQQGHPAATPASWTPRASPRSRVYQGRGVGGGSLVNGGMAVTPRRELLRGGPARRSTPTRCTRPTSRAPTPASGSTPSTRPGSRPTDCYQYARVGRKHANNVRLHHDFVPNVYDFNYMKQEAAGTVTASALAGEVIYGNNYGKRSLDKTYLAAAAATGKRHASRHCTR